MKVWERTHRRYSNHRGQLKKIISHFPLIELNWTTQPKHCHRLLQFSGWRSLIITFSLFAERSCGLRGGRLLDDAISKWQETERQLSGSLFSNYDNKKTHLNGCFVGGAQQDRLKEFEKIEREREREVFIDNKKLYILYILYEIEKISPSRNVGFYIENKICTRIVNRFKLREE